MPSDKSITLWPKLETIRDTLFHPDCPNFTKLEDARVNVLRLGTDRNLRAIEWKGLLCIEQNPSRETPTGRRARNGQQIFWVISMDTRKVIARIENSRVYRP